MDVKELLEQRPEAGDDSLINHKKSGGKRKHPEDNEGEESVRGPEPLDESSLRRLLLSLERKVLRNQEMRIKFADEPVRFMASEMELFEVLQELHVLSTQPELYRVLVEQKGVKTLLSLLSHDNTDVACACVRLLQELTELDDTEEMAEVSMLMDALTEEQLVALLVSNLQRLHEDVKEESDGVYNTLSIIENITDYNPDLTQDCESLIAWLLQRMRDERPFNTNKLYASEILSILVQNNEHNRRTFGSQEGVDVILKQVSYFKKHDPVSTEEQEFMENLYDILCACLQNCPGNRELFLSGEGIELMNLILREKRKEVLNSSVKMGALKVLSHALSSSDRGAEEILSESCKKFVDILGLRVIFPVFMKPKSIIGGVKKREVPAAVDLIEEQCLTIILSLLRFCETDQKKRIVAKFVECEFEKMERLLELHYKFNDRVDKFDEEIDSEEERNDPEGVYVKRVSEGGLFTLQLVDRLMATCSVLYEEYFSEHTEQESIRERLLKLLKMHASAVNHLQVMRETLKDLHQSLEAGGEKERIADLVARF